MGDVKKGKGVSLAVDKDLFFSYRRLTRAVFYLSIISPIISIIAVVFATIVVFVGKDKDKIVFMNASGYPTLVRIDNPDRFLGQELEVFIKDSIPQIFSWDFSEIQGKESFAAHTEKLQPMFTGKFFPDFFGGFKDIYLRSIVTNRIIVKAIVKNIESAGPPKGLQIRTVIVVGFRNIKLGDVTATSEIAQEKKFEVLIYKGTRSVENPFGLYIYGLSELGGS